MRVRPKPYQGLLRPDAPGRLGVPLRPPAADGVHRRLLDRRRRPSGSPPPRSAVSGLGSVVVNRLSPTTTSSPDSIRPRRAAWDVTSADFMNPDSTAATAPPNAATWSISARAPSTSSATFVSTTTDPVNRSSYSSRSDSYARTCWSRSDHCWSHGRGRP
jgi:hypothetical protein